MNVQQLKVFLEVCDSKTLLDASVKLGLKQPTVSFHLRSLEEALGVELFRRVARNLRRTEAADYLLPYARRIVALTDEAAERMAEWREGRGGRLKLGASYTPATYLMPPYLSEFQGQHPEIGLQLSVKKAAAILDMLRRHEIDVAIVSLPDAAESGIRITRLIEDELKLLFSPRHPLASLPSIGVEDLRNRTFLLHESGSTSRRLTDEWADRVGLRFESSMELGAIETIKEALKCNMGVGVLPRRSVVRETNAGELVQRELPGYRNRRFICLACRDEEPLSPPLELFRTFVMTRIAAAPPAESVAYSEK